MDMSRYLERGWLNNDSWYIYGASCLAWLIHKAVSLLPHTQAFLYRYHPHFLLKLRYWKPTASLKLTFFIRGNHCQCPVLQLLQIWEFWYLCNCRDHPSLPIQLPTAHHLSLLTVLLGRRSLCQKVNHHWKLTTRRWEGALIFHQASLLEPPWWELRRAFCVGYCS